MQQKIDFKRTLDSYQAKTGEFRRLELPERQYLMIDGHGDPNTSTEFSQAIESLYPLAYKLKFASKLELGRDYVVMPLEGLWWSDDMRTFTAERDKSRWDWTLMIMVPDWTEQTMFATAVELVAAKSAPARLSEVRLEKLTEGSCVQTLHLGSYDDEAETLAKLHDDVIPAQGL